MAEKPSIDETRQEGVPVSKVTCLSCGLVVFVEASDPHGTCDRCGAEIGVEEVAVSTPC